MVTLVDTSAFYAYLDARDQDHDAAKVALGRLGAEAVRVFLDDLLPVTRVIWMDGGDASPGRRRPARLGGPGRVARRLDGLRGDA